MNERIKALLNVCGMPNEQLMAIYDDQNQTFYMEQFAELIICETTKTIINSYRGHINPEIALTAVEEKLGVKYE